MERGHAHRLAGHPRDAVPAYQAAARRAPTRGLQAEAKVNLALALRGVALYREALAQVSDARRIFAGARDREGLAFANWARGSVLRYMGDIAAARQSFNSALGMYERLGSRTSYALPGDAGSLVARRGGLLAAHEGLAYTYCGLGGCARLGGAYRASLLNYQKAWRIFSRLREAHGLAYAACGTGSALRYAGRRREAAGWYRQAVARYRRLGDRANVGLAVWEWGMLERQRGTRGGGGLAARRFHEAAREFAAAGDRRGTVLAALALGRFRMARASARRLGLLAEAVHALVGLRGGAMTRAIRRRYRRLGVRPPRWTDAGLVLA